MSRHVLVVRPDSAGDVIIAGPAVRAAASGADRLTMLVGPRGEEAARMLPGVDDVRVWNCPWIAAAPAPPVDVDDVHEVVTGLRLAAVDEALILTSFHQSALPTALVLRLAGVPRIAAVSEDYPGSLLDVRIGTPPDGPEPLRMLDIAAAAGYRLPAGDDARLAVRVTRPPLALPERYVVLHPGVDAPARGYPLSQWQEVARRLAAAGREVVVTGTADEADLCAAVVAAAGTGARTLAGHTDLAQLGGVLRGATAVVVANTGPAHLAAAVGTPVVSLFAPVVPAVRWAPYTPDVVVLGDQHAACRDSRARTCPVPGHPCLATVSADEVVAALDALVGGTRMPAEVSR